MTTQNWRRIGIVEIRDRSGACRRYSNLKEALLDFGWKKLTSFLRRVEATDLADDGSVRPPRWRILDDLGMDIPVWRIRREAGEIQVEHLLANAVVIRLCPDIRPEEFRRTPVPRTGRRGRYCWARRIRTANEIRANAAVGAEAETMELGVVVRGRRKHLPTNWDDLPRNVSRSWKDHRRNRWK